MSAGVPVCGVLGVPLSAREDAWGNVDKMRRFPVIYDTTWDSIDKVGTSNRGRDEAVLHRLQSAQSMLLMRKASFRGH